MKFNPVRFYIITLLIALIPIYGNWRLILFGELTTGKVITYEEEVTLFNATSNYSILEFQTPDGIHKLRGPENIKYPLGKEFQILYYRSNPDHCTIYNLQGMILNTKTFLAGLLLVFWIAFYLSFLKPAALKKKDQTDAAQDNSTPGEYGELKE